MEIIYDSLAKGYVIRSRGVIIIIKTKKKVYTGWLRDIYYVFFSTLFPRFFTFKKRFYIFPFIYTRIECIAGQIILLPRGLSFIERSYLQCINK